MNRNRWLIGALLSAALAGCEQPAPVEPVPRPVERPAPPPKPVAKEPVPKPAPAEPAAPRQTTASRELERYYARVQAGLLAQGLLRRDGGGSDTPYDSRMVVENFVRIGLFEEYADSGGRLIARATASRLHRWEKPVRIEIEFGDSVSDAKRKRDRAEIETYARRLARVTGHPISTVADNGNFTVFIVSEDERRALGPRLTRMVPGISRSALNEVINLPRPSYCLVFALDPTDSGTYTQAVSIIRSEHPDLLRQSCIHEEIAQGLGLANDSPSARPSIFNDDEEFALLTPHDELLLKLLYDPRMRPGMTLDQAAAKASVIVKDYLDEES